MVMDFLITKSFRKVNFIEIVNFNKELNLNDLPKGVYYLKLEFGNEFISEKFIIN